MLLGDLKREMPYQEKNIIINKTVKLRGRDTVLAYITQKAEKVEMLTLCECQNNILDEEFDEPVRVINRYELERNLKNSVPNTFIKELTIGDEKLMFTSSSGFGFDEHSYRSYMHLQRLIDMNIDISVFDERYLKDLTVMIYEYEGDLPMLPDIDNVEISVKISAEHKQVHIGMPFTLQMGQGIPDRLSFFDRATATERFFYINKLDQHDVWAEFNKNFSDKRLEAFARERNLTVEEAETMKNQNILALERVCPKGFEISYIEYESEDGDQLQFYETEYLDSEVHRSNTASVMFMSSSSDKGAHGFLSRNCALRKVPEGFDGQVGVELFSRYINIPEETIIL